MENSKLEIRVFDESYVDRLCRHVKTNNDVTNYYKDTFPYELRFPKGSTNIFIDKNFNLDGDKSDLENSITLYNELSLSESQAADRRLWMYLTHVQFWDYMRKRW